MAVGAAAKDFVVNILGDSSKADQVFDAFGQNASKIALTASAAVVGANIGGALNKSLDISEGNAMLTAQLGLTASDADTYGKLAGDVWAGNFGESLEEVNGTLALVSQNIGDLGSTSKDELEKSTEAALTFVQVFGEQGADMERTTAAVGTMIKTGIADNATQAFDILTYGMQNGVDKGGDLLDTFIEYSTQFDGLGLSAEQAMGLMSQSLDAGARNADIGADALKEFFLQAKDATRPDTIAGFQALGLNAEEMSAKIAAGGPGASAALQLTLEKLKGISDPLAQATIGTQLFGTKSEDMAQSLLAMDLSTATDGMEKVAGSTQTMIDGLGAEPRSKIEAMKRELENWGMSLIAIPGPVGEATAAAAAFGPAVAQAGVALSPVALLLQGPVKSALGGAKQGLVDLASGWKDSKVAASSFSGTMGTLGGVMRHPVQSAKDLALAIGTGTVAMVKQGAAVVASTGKWIANTAAQIASKVATIAGSVASGIATAAQWAWNLAMSANPIGLIIIAIGALIAIVVLIIANWDQVSAFLIDTWNNIAAVATDVWNNVASFFTDLWNGIVAGIGAAVDWLVQMFMQWTVLGFIISNWQPIMDFFVGLWNGIIGWITTVWSGFIGWLSDGAALFVAGWSAIWSRVGEFFSGLWNGIIAGVQTAAGWVFSQFDAVVNFVGGLPGRIGAVASGMWNGITDAFRSAINWIIGMWNGLSFKIPSLEFMGMKVGGFTLAVPQIPYLANGGVTSGPALAVVGDNVGGQEVIEPLASYKAELAREREAVAAAYAARGASAGGGGDFQLTLVTQNGASPADLMREALWQARKAGYRFGGTR
jgi:phage-related minor tail protein